MKHPLEHFFKGRPVRIVSVAFPDLPHHAVYIGKPGTVEKTIKCRNEVKVNTCDGHVRYCSPENLEILA